MGPQSSVVPSYLALVRMGEVSTPVHGPKLPRMRDLEVIDYSKLLRLVRSDNDRQEHEDGVHCDT